MLKQSSYRNGRPTWLTHASMRRPVGLPFHCGTAPEETPAPCVTQSRRERMLMMRLKITGDLRWNGRPISQAKCGQGNQGSCNGPRPAPPARSSHGKPNNGSHAATSTQKPGRPPTMAVPRPRQPKRTNPKHDVEAQGLWAVFGASSAVNARKGPKVREAHPWPGFSQHSVRGPV